MDEIMRIKLGLIIIFITFTLCYLNILYKLYEIKQMIKGQIWKYKKGGEDGKI